MEQGVPFYKGAESRYLTSSSAADLCFGVFEKLDKCWDKVAANNLLINSLGDLAIYQHIDQKFKKSNIQTFSNLSATMYRTLQLLSSNRLRSAVNKTP